MPLAYIHFEPCPKCSEINHPKIHIAGTCKSGPMFRATCGTCHYEQKDAYESVKECSEAWNKESNEAWIDIFEDKYKRLMRQFNDFN